MNSEIAGDASAPAPANPMPPAPETGSLLPPVLIQYWHILLRWRWLVLAIIGASFAAGVTITYLTPSRYTATVQIQIDRSQKNVTNVEGLQSLAADRDLEFYETQYNLLKAKTLAQRVARSLQLGQSDEFYAAHGVKRTQGAAKSGLSADERAAKLLLGAITVTPIKNSRLVNVRYTCRSATMAARIANAWAQQFIAANLDREFSSTADARTFLEGRLATLKGNVERSEREAALYATQRDIVEVQTAQGGDGKRQTGQTLTAMDLVTQNQELARAVAGRIQAESRILGAGGATVTEALSNPTIAGLRQSRATVAAEYAKVRTQFREDFPQAVALAKQRDTLDAAIARELEQIRAARGQEYKEAAARETQLRRQVETLKAKLDAEQRDAIQYNIFQREADTNRQLYDGLLQRYKEIGVSAGVGVNNIAIIDPADVPSFPSSPVLLLNIVIALLLGAVASAVVILGLEQIDEGIREPGQIGPLLGVPLLGHVPLTDTAVMQEIQDPKSDLYEAFFNVRSNLDFATSHGFPSAVMVTSASPGEGKSTTAMALALMLARTGKRAVLIDADMRSPSVHKAFERENGAGLANYLAGQDDTSQLIQNVEETGLDLMLAGPVPPSAAELLSSDRLAQLVSALGETYDHVIIDAPPLIGLSDAPLISRAVEGCVFVIKAEGPALRGIRAAMARLAIVNVHVFGAVLNQLHDRPGGYGYGYGYGRRYGESRA